MAGRFPFGRTRPDADGERPMDVFVRGLVSGAVVGAVIAGSAIWERRRRQKAVDEPAIPLAVDAGEAPAPPAEDAAEAPTSR